MESLVHLYNTALGRLGGDEFTPLASPNENNSLADLCRTFLPLVLELTTSAFGWGFAERRAVLAETPGITPEGILQPEHPKYRIRCELPSDCLKPLYLDGYGEDVNERPVFIIEGRQLLCNERPAVLTYTARINDPKVWPPAFADALAWGLAQELATARINDARRQQFYMQKYEFALREAIARDKNQRNPHKPVSSWMVARFGNTGGRRCRS
jgi:hypothetical protein